MHTWCDMMVHEGRGVVGLFLTQDLLDQWRHIPVVIEDYPYAEMDYQGDLEMPSPPGQA